MLKNKIGYNNFTDRKCLKIMENYYIIILEILFFFLICKNPLHFIFLFKNYCLHFYFIRLSYVAALEIDSPRFSRRLRLTTLEESALADLPVEEFQASALSKDLKDLADCLNSTTVWNSETRIAVDVSIDLLRMIMNIYTENRGLLDRFGISGFGLISIHPSFIVSLKNLIIELN